MVWINTRHYPLARDVKTWGNAKIKSEYKDNRQGIAFSSFRAARQHQVFMRALKKEIELRKLKVMIK
jgi:hypothetical protein